MTDAPSPAAAAATPAAKDPSDERMEKLFCAYLAIAEKVAERRAAANGWMLGISTALTALYGTLAKEPAVASAAPLWRWGVPLAGLLVCFAWWSLIRSYGQLSRAKFLTLQEMEKRLPFQPFAHEQAIYKAEKRRRFTQIERVIPAGFALLHCLLMIGAFWP